MHASICKCYLKERSVKIMTILYNILHLHILVIHFASFFIGAVFNVVVYMFYPCFKCYFVSVQYNIAGSHYAGDRSGRFHVHEIRLGKYICPTESTIQY